MWIVLGTQGPRCLLDGEAEALATEREASRLLDESAPASFSGDRVHLRHQGPRQRQVGRDAAPRERGGATRGCCAYCHAHIVAHTLSPVKVA